MIIKMFVQYMCTEGFKKTATRFVRLYVVILRKISNRRRRGEDN
jgi:hypothetical protein